jgi:hypothetical protein
MLYMVVNTHSAESCAFRDEEQAQHLETAFDRFTQEAGAKEVSIRGSWVNRPGHEAFVLVDAPGPHAVDDLVVASGLVGRSTTRVLSVIALEEAVTPYTDAVIGNRAPA